MALITGRRLALRGTTRQWLARLHRWSGLAIMLLLTIASVTGVWLVFRQEIDRSINQRLRVVRPAATRLSEDDIVSLVERRFPDAMVSLVQFQRRPDDAVSLSLTARKPGSSERFDNVYVNPYTGDILGQRAPRSKGLSLASLDSFILGLHFTLLISEPGRTVMGLVAVVWLVTNFIGLALSWPAMCRRIGRWLPVVSARFDSGTYRASYGLHRAGGVWLFPVLMVLAFTSVELNLPQLVTPIVNVISPPTQRPEPGTPLSANDAPTTFNQSAAAVMRLFPEATVNNIYRDRANGRDSVYFHLPEDVNPDGDDFAFVDLRTGDVTAVKRPAMGSAGDRFMAWLFPLHTGAAFGWIGRALVALAGVVLIVTNVAGLYVWWVKWQMRRRQSVRLRHAA